MRILIALTYYRPHVSGLTIYTERLARGLARRGHAVTVLTSQFHDLLPRREHLDGIDVIRVPILTKVSKGVVMPRFPLEAWRAVRDADVVNIHLPQLEASAVALAARRRRVPVVMTYHGDLKLPPGIVNRVVQTSLQPLNHLAAHLADKIVVTTADYAGHSPFVRRHSAKLAVIPPLIEIGTPDPQLTAALAHKYGLNGRTRIGFAARFSAEKGVEYLLEALPLVLRDVPEACVAFTGAYKDTVGEASYHARLRPLLDRYRERLTFLDLLTPEELPSFYSLCHVVAVTSYNSTESFGLVQVESMLSGTPVVATDMPGVREAVRATGMGRIVEPRNSTALAAALVDVIRDRDRYRRPREEVARLFDSEAAIQRYEEMFRELVGSTPSRDG